jgi:hypothetical protein
MQHRRRDESMLTAMTEKDESRQVKNSVSSRPIYIIYGND